MKLSASGETYQPDLSFRDACRLLQKEWRRRKQPAEPISHALSRFDESGVYLHSAEDGLLLGVISEGRTMLSEDIVEASGLGIFGAEQV